MSPSISVIIPVYNRFGLLTPVVESILGQTLPVSEIILIDDGSTAHTPEMVESHIAERPEWQERVRYYYQENQGQSAANNNGIAKAKGEWLAFNAHDDLWLPQKLEWQFRALEKYGNECGLCFTDAWFMNNPHMKRTGFQSAGREFNDVLGIIHEPVRATVTRPHPMWLQTVVARADLVRRAGGLDAQLRYGEDHDFLFRMALITKFCYVNMPMALIDRAPAEERHIGESRNWHKEEFCLRMDRHCYEKQMRLGEALPLEVRGAIRKNLRSNQSAWANWYLTKGEVQKSQKAISAAAKYELTPAVAFKWLLMHLAPNCTRRLLIKRDQKAAPRYDRISWKTSESSSSTRNTATASAIQR